MSRRTSIVDTLSCSISPIAVCAAFVALGPGACGAAAAAKFDVAAIRPSPCQNMKGRQMSGGTLVIEKAPLPLMLEYGFGVKPSRIVSLPKWAGSACYDISAKSTTPVGGSELWPMLIPLMEERFRMKWHKEKREQPAYDLIIEKNGKLPAPREGNCSGSDPSKPPRPGRDGRMLGACGSLMVPMRPPAGMGFSGGRIKMSRLVEALTLKIGRPVIDKTGFTELFDLDLHFAYDSSLGGMSGGRPSDSGDPSGEPNIFTALRQQLGLRLVPSKAQIDVIVIDHIEQPSAN